MAQKKKQPVIDQQEQDSSITDYMVIRSRRRRRTMSLRIDHQGKVVIRAPAHTPKRDIESFFEQSRGWVARKLAERRTIQSRC